jgi:hypothetical protein
MKRHGIFLAAVRRATGRQQCVFGLDRMSPNDLQLDLPVPCPRTPCLGRSGTDCRFLNISEPPERLEGIIVGRCMGLVGPLIIAQLRIGPRGYKFVLERPRVRRRWKLRGLERMTLMDGRVKA